MHGLPLDYRVTRLERSQGGCLSMVAIALMMLVALSAGMAALDANALACFNYGRINNVPTRIEYLTCMREERAVSRVERIKVLGIWGM